MGKKKEYDFECDNCGAGVTEEDVICPNCGYSFEDEVEVKEERILECPGCGASTYESDKNCPVCGILFSDSVDDDNEYENGEDEDYDDTDEEEKESFEYQVVRFLRRPMGTSGRMELLINNNTSTSFDYLYIKIKFYRENKIVALDSIIISDIAANSEKVVVTNFHNMPLEFDSYDISFTQHE